MKRAFIIENPVASRSTPHGLETVLSVMKSEGWEIASGRTEEQGHAAELAAEAVQRGTEVIGVYGGDGTIMQAVEGMQGSDAVLGLIPGGTANLLARNLHISRSPGKAARTIATGSTRTIDLGRLETSAGTRFFAVGCGTGYDADMMAETTTEQKRRWGVGAYISFVVRTAHRIRPSPVRITIDGRTDDYEAASIVVANCNKILPPLLKLGADVTLDDGILDVIVIKANGFLGAAWAVWNLLWLQETPRVRRLRGTEVRVETAAPQVVQADGDICGMTPFTATIIPGGLTVMVPGADS